MKKLKKSQLWYNPTDRDRRTSLLERGGLIDIAADQEGRALLESYCRLYRKKL